MWKTLHVASYRRRLSSHFRPEASYRNLYIDISEVGGESDREILVVRAGVFWGLGVRT